MTAHTQYMKAGLTMTFVSGAVLVLVGLPEGGAVASGVTAAATFLKGAKIGSVVIGLLFLAFKFGLVKIIVIQEGETGLLIKRGRVVLDKKTGLPRLVNSDRYQLHVAVWRHIAIVSNRERPLELGSIPFTVADQSWVLPLTLVWSINGDAVSMRDALIKVSDGNRFDEKFGALTEMVQKQCLAGLSHAFTLAKLDESTGVPAIDFSLVNEDLKVRLNRYGSAYHEVLAAPVHRYNAPYDGNKEIADAIREFWKQIVPFISSDSERPKLASA